MTEQPLIRISFKDAFQFILRGLVPAVLVGLVAAVAAYFIVRSPEPVYRATAVLLATRPGVGFYNELNIIEPTQVDPEIYRSAVVQGGLMERALVAVTGTELTADELVEWRRRIRVRVDENLISGLVHIDVDHEDAELAEQLANSIATALLSWDRDRVVRNVQATVTSLSQTVLILGAQIATAEASGDEREAQLLRSTRDQRLSQLRSAEALNLSAVAMGLLEPFRDAVVDPKPVNEREVFVAAIAFVVFFLLVYVILFLLRVADPRVRSQEDLMVATGIPATAVIPPESQRTKFREGVDRLASTLVGRWAASTVGAEPQGLVIAVTSPKDASERSLLAVHIAAAFVEAGWQVLLVDADLKEGLASLALPVTRRSASMARLVRGGEYEEPVVLSGNSGDKLSFLPAGEVPVEGAAMLVGRRIGQLIHGWRNRFQVVVIDSTAVASSAATVAISREADVTVLAVATGSTTIRMAQSAVASLAEAGVTELVTALTTRAKRSNAAKPQSRLPEDSRQPAEAHSKPQSGRATVTQRPRGRP